MCYSAQVVQMARKLSRQLGIRIDYDEVERLFFRRLEDPGTNISRGFEANFDEPATDQERRIKGAIDEHRSRVASKMEKDLFTQKTRLVNAERSLKEKETKKAREDVRIATTKIETLSTKLSRLRSSEPNEEDDRIFPFVYAGVIIKQGGQNLLTPMRYHCRPAGKPAFTLRGDVVFQWRRGAAVLQTATVPTTAGHKSLAGADPHGYSAATCTLT